MCPVVIIIQELYGERVCGHAQAAADDTDARGDAGGNADGNTVRNDDGDAGENADGDPVRNFT